MIKNKVFLNDEYVRKKRNDKIIELYEYLKSRNFYNFPEIINIDKEYIKFKKIDEENYTEEIKGKELIKTVASLHYKTLFHKEVSKNKYKKIYNKLKNNIEYIKNYYEEIITNIEQENYMSPSHYLFARNYSAILSSIEYAQKELEKWFKIVENKSKERVCIVHNNLSFDHFIKGDKNYLISFDKYVVDTPVVDLYKFYKKEGYKLDFKSLLKEYSSELELLEEELKLFNILVSLPPKIVEIEDEMLNSIEIKSFFHYIHSTMNTIA